MLRSRRKRETSKRKPDIKRAANFMALLSLCGFLDVEHLRVRKRLRSTAPSAAPAAGPLWKAVGSGQ
jgi:hypothetical protein